MDRELKPLWVAALRSGKYQQTAGILRSQANRFCCLGVLCEVTGVPHGEKGGYCFAEEDISRNQTPPAGFVGLSSDDLNELVNMNDDQRRDFNFIADYIEEHL